MTVPPRCGGQRSRQWPPYRPQRWTSPALRRSLPPQQADDTLPAPHGRQVDSGFSAGQIAAMSFDIRPPERSTLPPTASCARSARRQKGSETNWGPHVTPTGAPVVLVELHVRVEGTGEHAIGKRPIGHHPNLLRQISVCMRRSNIFQPYCTISIRRTRIQASSYPRRKLDTPIERALPCWTMSSSARKASSKGVLTSGQYTKWAST